MCAWVIVCGGGGACACVGVHCVWLDACVWILDVCAYVYVCVHVHSRVHYMWMCVCVRACGMCVSGWCG